MTQTPHDDELLDALTDEQRELYEAMSDVSEISYAAGWLEGNEYEVWRLLHSGGRYGQETWDDAEAEELQRVRRALGAADCWIVWSDGAPRAVSLDDWADCLAERARRHQLD